MSTMKTRVDVYIQFGEAGSRKGFTSKSLIPERTNFYPTGRTYKDGQYNWTEGRTQWLKDNDREAGWIPAKYLTEAASTSGEDAREKSALDWYAGVAGRSLDVDKIPHNKPEQCVDVSKHLVAHEFGGPLKPYGNGKDVAYNVGALPGWTRIKYVPDMLLYPLDILSWGAPYGVDRETKKVYGHTAVQLQYSKTPIVAQQNGFDGDTVVHKSTLDTNGLLWVARPTVIVKSTPEANPDVDEYTIREGDTLWKIGQTIGVSVSVLRELNPGLDPLDLRIGSKIRVG